MKFVWKELFDAMQSIVSRCWLEPAGHGLPPPFTPVLAACRVGNHCTVYAAMVDEFGAWQFPEFQGDENDIEVLLWMPRPKVSMRVDTAFALNADQLEAVTTPGINKMAELSAALAAALAAATQRAEAAERERDQARRHVELLREELDAVPVAALDALADNADDVPGKVSEWLAWATLGAHWQPADQPCPDCGANALAVAVHADGTIEQWLCDECGYVAAPKDQVQL